MLILVIVFSIFYFSCRCLVASFVVWCGVDLFFCRVIISVGCCFVCGLIDLRFLDTCLGFGWAYCAFSACGFAWCWNTVSVRVYYAVFLICFYLWWVLFWFGFVLFCFVLLGWFVDWFWLLCCLVFDVVWYLILFCLVCFLCCCFVLWFVCLICWLMLCFVWCLVGVCVIC